MTNTHPRTEDHPDDGDWLETISHSPVYTNIEDHPDYEDWMDTVGYPPSLAELNSFRRGPAKAATKATTKADGLPGLRGSAKQKEWALQLRGQFLAWVRMRHNASEIRGLLALATDAALFIDNRNAWPKLETALRANAIAVAAEAERKANGKAKKAELKKNEAALAQLMSERDALRSQAIKMCEATFAQALSTATKLDTLAFDFGSAQPLENFGVGPTGTIVLRFVECRVYAKRFSAERECYEYFVLDDSAEFADVAAKVIEIKRAAKQVSLKIEELRDF